MRIRKNRRRSVARPDFFQHAAIGHLRKSPTTNFFRCCHPEHADAPQAVDDFAWNIRIPIDRYRIQFVIEKLSHFRDCLIHFRLLRSGKFWIRHRPIRNEPAEEQPFGKAHLLPAGKK